MLRRLVPLTPNPSPPRGEGGKSPATALPQRERAAKHALTPNPSPGVPGEGSKTPVSPKLRREITDEDTMTDLATLLNDVGRPRVLVVGDLVLDRYTWGNAQRISPEAPVPVLDADLREVRPGGAASVAALLRGLDAEVLLAGVTGEDADARPCRKCWRKPASTRTRCCPTQIGPPR